MATDESPNLLDQIERRRRQALHLEGVAVQAFQPLALGDHHRAVDRRKSNFVNMHLSQQVAFQVQTFSKRLQPNQHTALAVGHPFAVQLHQTVARLIALHQQQQAEIGNMLKKTLHRATAGKEYQHALMLFTLQLFAKIGGHFRDMLLFVIN